MIAKSTTINAMVCLALMATMVQANKMEAKQHTALTDILRRAMQRRSARAEAALTQPSPFTRRRLMKRQPNKFIAYRKSLLYKQRPAHAAQPGQRSYPFRRVKTARRNEAAVQLGLDPTQMHTSEGIRSAHAKLQQQNRRENRKDSFTRNAEHRQLNRARDDLIRHGEQVKTMRTRAKWGLAGVGALGAVGLVGSMGGGAGAGYGATGPTGFQTANPQDPTFDHAQW